MTPRELRPPSCLVARPGAPSLSPEGEVGVQRRGDPLAGGQQARRWALHRFGLLPLPPPYRLITFSIADPGPSGGEVVDGDSWWFPPLARGPAAGRAPLPLAVWGAGGSGSVGGLALYAP
ncbi:hypothetical protein NDU88_004342 [Pleurodeles waltl]|uniref:Uncharacterized protein n=1 Tax=Pleurodeles waltl TaxID=8319 RepID=A0AAV7LHY6_PLEWA|nr:hypothetical protein NDU88_004342 [Pleurodeles waltl]